ncbi:MAG: T9SS type A sorting domain-containing protein, partial [Bacteroidia bacterium]|nr:T9SS type A sorting domain-containing protein [Bacteroidia bacterium]
LVMNRKANTSIYIDGSLVKYEQSMFFGGLVGAEMALGARRQQTSVFISYYDFFTGNMDEVRIWNLARTVKQLNMDMNSKLKGDEMGLLAYYPLDIYNFLGTDLISNLDDQVEGSSLVATAVGGNATNVDVPNLKDARPVQQIAYNWVVNEDQIVITVNEQPSAIERCILEFTVDRVEDLRENRIASPVTWTAYVKKNTVIWDADRLYFEKLLYAELTFDVDILNIGGTDQNFSISNLPAWLTASETGGTLSPDNYQTITFTVSPVVNIGDYEASVFLTSDFGYNEQLSISLKVRKTSPSWTVNPTDFQYSMNVIGQIQFDQTFSTNSDDKVAAFVDGECRGVANSTYVKSYDMFEVNLTIYSNVAYGEQILYKVWNAGEGVIHTEVLPIDTFLSNSIHGTPSNPVIIRALGTYQEDIPLYAGWNWLSLNLNSYKQANINWLFDGMNMVHGDQVKDKQYFEIYDAIYGWSGSLSAHGGIKNESMYLVKSANAQTLTVVGNRINPLTTPISISTGWNYLGYLPALNISVDEALASLSPSQGDVIKCQSSFAMYDNYTGWIGNLDYMKPFVGYMYYANAPGILYYPEFGTKSGFSFTGDKMADLYEKYNINCKNYMLNMTISGILQNEYGVPVIQEMTLLAYEDSICVGVTPATWNNASGNHNYFLTAFSNSGLNNITFKAEAENGTIYNIVEEVNYQPNGIVGSPSLPIVLTIEGFYENTTQGNDIHAYPNPFVNQIKLFYDISDAGNVRIQVYNILGEVVSVLSNRHHEAGHYQLIWQTSEAGTNIPDGIYFVELKNGAFSKILKVSKIK